MVTRWPEVIPQVTADGNFWLINPTPLETRPEFS